MRRPWELSRRTFLRGAGTLMALPLLEAMLPSIARAQSAGAPPPRRLLAFFVPNGMYMPDWYPPNTGEGYTLSPLLTPLASYKSDFLVLSGLGNEQCNQSVGVDIGHVAPTADFLTSVPVKSSPVTNGISMDQVAASHLKPYTRFASLELGTRSGGEALRTNISWSGPATPMTKETRPDVLFDRLFAGMGSNQEALARRRRRLSVLDYVLEDASSLQARLGRQDQLRMDEYLTGVRELETRIQQTSVVQCTPGTRPQVPTDVRGQLRALMDLVVLAFQCDLTRVATIMHGEATDDSAYNFLSIPDGQGGTIPVSQGHHTLSHEITPGSVSQRMYSAICRWEVEQLAYLLSKMKAVQEPDGTLLDNSLVLFSSEIGESMVHDTWNLPIILAGRAGGKIRPGRHILYKDYRGWDPVVPVARLYLSMLTALGVNVSRFGGDGTSPLPSLT